MSHIDTTPTGLVAFAWDFFNVDSLITIAILGVLAIVVALVVLVILWAMSR